MIALILALAAAACGGPALVSPPPATQQERPEVPAGWVTVASEDGSVMVSVPPDLVVRVLPDTVLVQGAMAGDITPLEIWATGPAGAQPQPRGGEPLRGWLEAGGWAPRAGAGGVTETADEDAREEHLPTGRAYRIAVTAQPGMAEASRVIVYAIETERGFGVLRILGQPETIERRADELALVALLVTFDAP